MAPLCDTTASISGEKLPGAGSPEHVYLQRRGVPLLAAPIANGKLEMQLPLGDYTMTVVNSLANPQPVQFTIKADQVQLDLGLITLTPTRLATLIGKPAPELRGIAEWRNGKPVKLVELRGKVVVLDFWGYWCGPCLASMPGLMKLYDAYPGQDVAIIAIHDSSLKNLDKLRDKTESARKKLWKGRDLPFRLALAGGGVTKIEGTENSVNGQVIADYGITAFPTTLLIDRQGNVVSLLDPGDVDGARKKIAGLLRN
jgi:thiol-disulfide isomerase/thioredoxin